MSQFGITLKSADPEHPDDVRHIPVLADGIVDAAKHAEAMAWGTPWRVHQIVDLERD